MELKEFAHIIECLTGFETISYNNEKFEIVCEDNLEDISYDVKLIFRYDSANDIVFAECNYGDDVLSFENFTKHIIKEKYDEFKNYDDSQLCIYDYLYKADKQLDEYIDDVIDLWKNGFEY